MSHNNPYRTSPPHTLDHRAHSPGDSGHTSENGLYAPQYSSSVSATRSSVMPQENVLSLLSSCGLEPEDLARLAELPEDVLTVESLPHILQQMKDKKGVVKPGPSASTSFSASSFHYSSTSRPTVKVDQLCSQPVQYPFISSTRPPPEPGQEHWDTPRTSSSVRAGPLLSSSSSSGCIVDMDVRAGPPAYGKSDPGQTFNPIGQRLGSSNFFHSGPTDRQVPNPHPTPLLPQHPTHKNGRHHQKPWSSSSRSNKPFSIPSMKQALDFHGTPQAVFPYTCSLCDITVLSEKVWTQHINSTMHADRQLHLLQEFPNWDCRVTTNSSDGGQSQSRDTKAHNVFTAGAANHNQGATQPSNNSQKKAKGKVVCVKFPPQSVDETYLRKLTEPFGKILKILMFPSLAFVELGSFDQANDLVKFHVNYPPTVNGSQIEFSISSTFSFLQSSQVVSFTPAPEGEDGRSDLISIVKRFGVPLYTMFLPSKAYMEMKTVTEAQKLVDYYSANVLRISNVSITVSFSREYKSLARLSSARRYEEHGASRSTKRVRTRSRSRGRRSRTRSRSRDKKARTRSKSREKYEKVYGTRTQSTDNSKMEKRTRTRSRSRDKSNGEKQTRSCSTSSSRSRSRSRCQDDTIEISNNNQEASSRSTDLSSSDKQTATGSRSRSQDETRSPSNTETKSNSKETFDEPMKPDKPAPVIQSKPKAVDITLMEEENDEEDDERLSVNSDIEGMEVIAEDGEQLVDEELEEEEEYQEEEDEEEYCAAVNTQPSEPGEEVKEVEKKEEEVKGKEKKEDEVMDKNLEAEEETKAEEEKKGQSQVTCLEEEDEAFPMDPENFITLDELNEDECAELSDETALAHESDSESSRVIYIRNLPPCFYSDADFLDVLRDCGTAVRYLLIRRRQEGFVEMSTPSEAAKAARELNARPTFLNKSKLEFIVSYKYHRLTCGWTVKPEADSESRRSQRRREAPKRTPERESRREPAARNSPQNELRNTSEEESASQETSYLKKTSAETQRMESPEVETQEKTESLDVETRQRTKSPDVEMSTTSKKEVPQISGAPQDKIQVNRSPESKKVKEDTPEDKPAPQTDLRSAPPDNERNDNSKKTEDEKLPGGLMKDKQVKLTEAEGEEDFYNIQTSFKPVGVEFVRPVVGYFCNLCQLIYADEEKAKTDHCSTLEHYRRYQEKTGKDPWTS